MQLTLTWITPPFSDKKDIPLLDLEIFQEEDSFAKAHLVIDVRTSLPPTGTEGIIRGNDKELFLKGHLVGTPIYIKGDVAKIELIAYPSDFKERIKVLQKACRVHPYWDGLWVPPERHTDFQEIQDVRTASLYCDRRTGELSLSDWFEGRQTLTLTDTFFPDSLVVKVIRAPLKSCTINVHAHWVQKETGVASLSSAIKRAFPRLKVNTYTQDALLKKWPEPGKRLGRSGYWVIKSTLKPMIPAASHYPTYSSALPLTKEEGEIKPYRLKRYWFKPSLWVGWQVRQKRKETLSLTLDHAFQPLFPGEGEHKTLEFTLQNINPDPRSHPWKPDSFYRRGAKVCYEQSLYTCKKAHTSSLSFGKDQAYWTFKKLFHTPLGHPARGSFFTTERGYLAAEHAMERAKVELAKSSRCLEVSSFEAPWESLRTITTDVSVTLRDSRLPGGTVKGKVVKYAFVAKGETGERFGHVTLLCGAGKENVEKKIFHPTPDYTLDDYCEKSYQVHENALDQTPSGLSYLRYDKQGPFHSLFPGPVVRGVRLTHGPQDQEKAIRQCAYRSPSFLRKSLSQSPTRLRLFLKDLRAQERLDSLIPVTMTAPWSAPLLNPKD